MPEFTHSELMQLWHAVSQYVENWDQEELETAPTLAYKVALRARGKLDEYVTGKALAEHPTASWPAPTTADGGYTVGDALGFQRPEPVSSPLQPAAEPANSQLTGEGEP